MRSARSVLWGQGVPLAPRWRDRHRCDASSRSPCWQADTARSRHSVRSGEHAPRPCPTWQPRRRSRPPHFLSGGAQPLIALPNGPHEPTDGLLDVRRRMHFDDFEWNEENVLPGSVWVRVDLARQTLSVFQGGHEIGTAVILYDTDAPRRSAPSRYWPRTRTIGRAATMDRCAMCFASPRRRRHPYQQCGTRLRHPWLRGRTARLRAAAVRGCG